MDRKCNKDITYNPKETDCCHSGFVLQPKRRLFGKLRDKIKGNYIPIQPKNK